MLFEDEFRPVFMISVAAELAEMHPQTLRMYERRGLIRPRRSSKSTRLYSLADVERLRRIQQLVAEVVAYQVKVISAFKALGFEHRATYPDYFIMPDGENSESPVCNLPDTLPADFLFAECRGYGAEIWRSFFWDQFGWQGDQYVPENMSKWESFVE